MPDACSSLAEFVGSDQIQRATLVLGTPTAPILDRFEYVVILLKGDCPDGFRRHSPSWPFFPHQVAWCSVRCHFGRLTRPSSTFKAASASAISGLNFSR